jgi:uncharacterized surface protein with fasciclin (FAS1) repeats
MNKRNIILFLGVIVASIIGTKSFAEPVEKPKGKEIGSEDIIKIINTIKNNPDFSIFYEAIDQAELSKKIAKLDEMTLLIPSNRAFKLLPGDVWENFMDIENKAALVKLINYHVIPERVEYDVLKNSKKLNTLENQSVKIFNQNELKIENAVVKKKHEGTAKIIIYEIDRLIMPL